MTTTRQPRQPPTTAHIWYAQQQQQSLPQPAHATVTMDPQHSAQIDPQPNVSVAPTIANMTAANPGFFASRPDPEDAFQPSIKGFQEFLVSKLE